MIVIYIAIKYNSSLKHESNCSCLLHYSLFGKKCFSGEMCGGYLNKGEVPRITIWIIELEVHRM